MSIAWQFHSLLHQVTHSWFTHLTLLTCCNVPRRFLWSPPPHPPPPTKPPFHWQLRAQQGKEPLFRLFEDGPWRLSVVQSSVQCPTLYGTKHGKQFSLCIVHYCREDGSVMECCSVHLRRWWNAVLSIVRHGWISYGTMFSLLSTIVKMMDQIMYGTLFSLMSTIVERCKGYGPLFSLLSTIL
jgi:hypothetical protein